MKQSKNISLFKITFLFLISIWINSLYLYGLILLLCLLTNKKEALIYFAIVCLFLVINNFRYDFLPIGIVIEKGDDYCIVDKVFYRVKLYSDGLEVGSIVKTWNSYASNLLYEQKRNILFHCFKYKKIGIWHIKSILYQRIIDQNETYSSILLKQFYNITTNYDESLSNISFSLSTYYLLKKIANKNKTLSLLFVLIYSFCFCFDTKFILIILDVLLSSHTKIDKLSMKILFLIFLNPYLLLNYSILLSLLVALYSIVSFPISFSFYFSIIESYIFEEFDPLNTIFFVPLLYLRVLYLMSCIMLLFLKGFGPIFDKWNNCYVFIMDICHFSIRGHLTIIGIFLYFFVHFIFKLKSKYGLFVYTLILLSPFNQPNLSVNFIDVGQGDSILIDNYLHFGVALIDTGSTYNYHKLKKYLYSKGIYTIDYLIITHNDSDHNGNLDALQKDFTIKEIVQEKKDVELYNLYFKNYDLGDYENDNDNSLVYSLNVKNDAILFTGDISKEVEYRFLRKYAPVRYNILKVSHHGSNTATSDYFVSEIKPEYAIISTNGKYNHPSDLVVETLDKYKVKQFITKEVGSISFTYSCLCDYIICSNFDVIMRS